MNNELNTWHFDTNNDKLVELVLTGKKQQQPIYITEIMYQVF